jgi:chromosome partitioning protein
MGTTAFVNQKGGVGKTTVTLGLAAALGDRGRSTLVVDLDPQSNATTGLGIFDAEHTVDSAMLSEAPGAMAELVREVSWPSDSIQNLPMAVAGSPKMAAVEHQLVADVVGAQDRLATCLEGLSDRFDEILIDCPPSLGLLTVNALFAADRAVVVTEPAAWSADGVQQIITNINRIARRRNGSPELAGVVVNRVGRTRDAAYWSKELRQQYPSLVLNPDVRLRAAVAEASASSLPLQSVHRSGAIEAMADFADLADSLFGPEPRLEPGLSDHDVLHSPGMEHRYAGI